MNKLLSIPNDVIEELSINHISEIYGGETDNESYLVNDGKKCNVINSNTNCSAINQAKKCSATNNQSSSCSVTNNSGNCSITGYAPFPGSGEYNQE